MPVVLWVLFMGIEKWSVGVECGRDGRESVTFLAADLLPRMNSRGFVERCKCWCRSQLPARNFGAKLEVDIDVDLGSGFRILCC